MNGKYLADEIKQWDTEAEIDKKWVLARPYSEKTLKRRIYLAWLVLTGKADVLEWYKQ